jgi:E3 ubiquitin-protein ligase TRIP12
MPFSIVFYKWMLGQEENLNLQAIVHIRDKLMNQYRLTNQQAINKLNTKKRLKSKDDSQTENSPCPNLFDENDQRLFLDGCKIDDLSLVFILPGYPNVELKKGGKDCLVTIHNLDQYVDVRSMFYYMR